MLMQRSIRCDIVPLQRNAVVMGLERAMWPQSDSYSLGIARLMDLDIGKEQGQEYEMQTTDAVWGGEMLNLAMNDYGP